MGSHIVNRYKSHGTGEFKPSQLRKCGMNVIFEKGVLIFHPESICIGDNVYIGHNTIIKGYYKNEMNIGSDTWVGQNCFFHSAGGIEIGHAVGVGPGVQILTSKHQDNLSIPIISHQVKYAKVQIKSGCDIGVGAIVLPGITIGKGVVVGAGSVVSKSVDDDLIVAGVPARVLRSRFDV